jgi:hypothetical protein
MKKIVSVSLFGDDPKYLRGSAGLLESIEMNLPGWQVVFFVGVSVPMETLSLLESRGASLVVIEEKEDLSAAAWRFRVDLLGWPEWVIFRDADSVISRREASAIEQWVRSGLTGHIIRDHPFHSSSIMAGLWGVRSQSVRWLSEEVEDFEFSDRYGSDQEFLNEIIYPKIVGDSIVHSSFHRHEGLDNSHAFTVGHDRLGGFCGESVTSSLTLRAYARAHRMFAARSCKCDPL